jgi:hypothetical protein
VNGSRCNVPDTGEEIGGGGGGSLTKLVFLNSVLKELRNSLILKKV